MISDFINTTGKINKKEYENLYKESLENNASFWKEQGKRIDWINPYTKIKDVVYSKEKVDIKWFYDGTLNVAYNCIDRHANKTPNKIAIIWEGDNPEDHKKITYKELLEKVNRTANALKSLGVKKGDCVTVYLTMIPELAYTMLACARIGAIHSIIFGGFSSESIANRIKDCNSKFIVTADQGIRGGKIIPLKKTVDDALENCPSIKKCLYFQKSNSEIKIVNKLETKLN